MRQTAFAPRRFVDRPGLQRIRLEPIGGAPEVGDGTCAKSALRVPELGAVAAMALQRCAPTLRRTRLGRRLAHGPAGELPLGYALVARRTEREPSRRGR